MPLRTAKPYYRVQKKGSDLEVAYFTSISGRLLRRGMVRCTLNDPVEASAILEAYISQFCVKPTRQEM